MTERTKPAPHGWLLLDKPRELGSTQAVGLVKRVLRQGGYKKTKVGHGGTLDPLAEGVLPIALGEATKLAGRMLDASKIYDFTVSFGTQTDTLDTEGEVVATSDHVPTGEDIAAILPQFTGAIEQAPPAYSAIKIDGKRAYDRARAGEEVVMKLRATTIHSLEILDSEPAAVTLRAHVTKGTYIRSLARDIALALGSVGHVTYLRRIKAGPFTEEQAISLDSAEEIAKGAPIENLLLPLEAGLDDIPVLSLEPDSAQAVRQGRVLSDLSHSDGLHLAKLGKTPVALMELEAGSAKVVRGFNLPDVAE
ncbi:tRNA pseudouridine(55) synthase TruB [Qipengyuania sp. 1NDH17]|uniref:tRNA pseudouridine synthase B n=1 Tax=Qipengyuania polymorpha TaxID=2867234 RepID=A0ABS7J0Q4_9SPHN|nr:tRNA pseudouridine(55) synthase TruB [Qipengyuania polymorpha]MBX7459313.1 tRNA pseudouridine(55) synthase TruB [Qipengyuania polymorpha]